MDMLSLSSWGSALLGTHVTHATLSTRAGKDRAACLGRVGQTGVGGGGLEVCRECGSQGAGLSVWGPGLSPKRKAFGSVA